MSGTQVSAWQTPNELLTSMETPAIVQRNQLLNQEAQQTINANEMEQISRASNWVISQDPENKDPAKQAAAYGAAVKLLRANNFAKNAPEQYPGFDAMQMMARQGTPSAEQFKVGENRAALAALAPGATPSTTAPTTDGGGGGGTSDNNFGNIRPTGASSGFNTYATPQEGVAAMSSNLAAYASKHGINTLNGLTARWAPKGDGNNDPTAYAASLGKMLGLDPNAEINLADPLLQSRLIPAMAQIEKGRPFSQPRDVLLAGIQAGLGGAAPAAAPGGGVAARNPGAVQVAGPGAGAPAATTAPPAAYATAPTKEAATAQAIATGKPVLIEGGQGAAALPSGRLVANLPDLPAAPAATAPAATAPPPPPQVALPPRPPIGQDGLQEAQRHELAVLRATGRISPADYIAKQEQMVSHNDALLQQWQTEVRTTQNQAAEAADRAERIRLERESGQRAAATAQREQQKFEQGSTQADKDTYTLTHNDPSTPEYADAWTRKKWEVAPNGNVVEKDVSQYPAPTRSIQRPSFLPAPTPQGLDEVRKADTDAKVITSAIDHYTDVFAATGGTNWGAYFDNPQSPQAQQLLGAFDRLKTVLRSPVYYNTGVLQPAEMAMLKEDLVSPKTLRGLFATPQALATRLNEIKIAILTRQDAELRSVGKDGVIVRDKADFAKIPEGGRYYDEDGNLRIK